MGAAHSLNCEHHIWGDTFYYTMLCYAMLCYAMLYYTILYYTILYYTIRQHNITYHSIMYCIFLPAVDVVPAGVQAHVIINNNNYSNVNINS